MVAKTYEIRDPVHGFISFNEWEREIINHSVFQRLRRIKQLALTDMVYPGANHTRFEHSLGVMNFATRMYDNIVRKCKDVLVNFLHYDTAGLERDRMLVRLASLLHDVGHPPFSHAGEGLMPPKNERDSYSHEDYSAAIIENFFQGIIEEHPLNQNYHLKAEEVSGFLTGSPKLGRSLLWRNLLSGQLDADRSDYLLRDSVHTGVNYGSFDIDRLLVTLTVAFVDGNPTIAVEEGGWHAAEGLVLSRYMMFTQVYFQHTRRAYDYHVNELLKEVVSVFPSPNTYKSLEEYIDWDDWKVFSKIKSKNGFESEHMEVLLNRNHIRKVHQTSENPDMDELKEFDEQVDKIGEKVVFIDEAEKSWYKFGNEDVVVKYEDQNKSTTLSHFSSVVKGLKPVGQKRIYVKNEVKKQFAK